MVNKLCKFLLFFSKLFSLYTGMIIAETGGLFMFCRGTGEKLFHSYYYCTGPAVRIKRKLST